MPLHGESRQKWIKAIEGHQINDCCGVIRYKICHLHFHPYDMKFLKRTTNLKKDAVPSIFPNSQEYLSIFLLFLFSFFPHLIRS